MDFTGLWVGIAAVFEPLKVPPVYARVKSGKYEGVCFKGLNRIFRIEKGDEGH